MMLDTMMYIVSSKSGVFAVFPLVALNVLNHLSLHIYAHLYMHIKLAHLYVLWLFFWH